MGGSCKTISGCIAPHQLSYDNGSDGRQVQDSVNSKLNRAEEMPAQDIVQSFNRPSIKKTNY